MNPLFDLPQMSLDKKIRLITTFSGIGAQEMAMKAIGADFEIYKAVEFDRFAINSYNAVHGTSFPVLDICNVHAKDFEIVDKENYNYIFVYSFPCQALSVAGKMGGMKENSGTTSSLLWEIKRILSEFSEDELPDVLLMENVPQVHSEKNMPDFNRWIDFLRSRGYVNYYQDLNAKDFGIPQNWERCFMVSVLSDKFIDFEFPKPIKLDRVMKDFLESAVDERYYINNEKAEKLIEQLVENGTIPYTKKQDVPVYMNYKKIEKNKS